MPGKPSLVVSDRVGGGTVNPPCRCSVVGRRSHCVVSFGWFLRRQFCYLLRLFHNVCSPVWIPVFPTTFALVPFVACSAFGMLASGPVLLCAVCSGSRLLLSWLSLRRLLRVLFCLCRHSCWSLQSKISCNCFQCPF